MNYIEGQAAIDARALGPNSAGSAKLAAGQILSTDNGRAEILLTPGIIVRTSDHSAVQMVSPDLANTVMTVQKGRALVEVAGIFPANNVRIGENGSSAQLLKPGLYEFDADRGQLRVFDGEAVVEMGGRSIELKSGHQLTLNAIGKLKAVKFDRQAYVDDFYRWASLRSSYLAEANADVARTYAGGSGWSPGVWYGNGWYWDPWFGAYTFLPADGIFWDPFGWGFYSPWFAFEAPYFGYGFGFGGGFYHHFGPGYHAPLMAGNRSTGFVGRAHSVGGGLHGFSRSGSFGAGSMRSGGFGGGGFHGGGFGGGGFHGGGGGGGGRR